jgi:hypothetical protein
MEWWLTWVYIQSGAAPWTFLGCSLLCQGDELGCWLVYDAGWTGVRTLSVKPGHFSLLSGVDFGEREVIGKCKVLFHKNLFGAF